jgi:hypothetical protein
VIGFGNDLLARVEGGLALGRTGHGQIAHADIHADDLGMLFWGRISSFQFQAHRQIKLLAGLIIPEFGGSNPGSLLEKSYMLVIAAIGNDHPSFQSQDAHLLVWLQTIVPVIVVGQSRGDVLWRLIQALVALLGSARFTILLVLFELALPHIKCACLLGDEPGKACIYLHMTSHPVV